MPNNNRCIVILGMHRSGTSALAGMLSLLGIYPGDTLLPAKEGNNPKGFWEHAEIVSIHNQLLDALGSSWDNESPLPSEWWHSPLAAVFRSKIIKVLRRDFDNLPIWLIKDPRICRLLPLWQEVFRELACQPLFILALRSPTEVAHSLRKRDDLEEEASCLMWLTHMLEAEYQTRGRSRTFVNYERLLSDWRSSAVDIGQTLRINWPATVEDAAPDIDTFLDSNLRHHAECTTLPDHPACLLAKKGFDLLSSPFPSAVELDQLRIQTDELISLVAPWSKRLRQTERRIFALITQNSRVESENVALQAEIKRIKSTVSWQVTKPLRFAWHILRNIFPS